jgi:hypothetical protein
MKATKAMKTIKVSEATGSALNWLVANCEGHEIDSLIGGAVWYYLKDSLTGALEVVEVFNPSTEWSQGGPIIEREGVKVAPTITSGVWMAQIRHTKAHPLVDHPVLAGWTNQNGPTPLIAAMRCYCISKLGDTAEVPDELL